MSIFEIALVHSACMRVRVSFMLDLEPCMGRTDDGRRVQWKGKATDTVSKPECSGRGKQRIPSANLAMPKPFGRLSLNTASTVVPSLKVYVPSPTFDHACTHTFTPYMIHDMLHIQSHMLLGAHTGHHHVSSLPLPSPRHVIFLHACVGC